MLFASAGYKRKELNPETFGSYAEIEVNFNRHKIKWYATKNDVALSMESLRDEYYKELEWKGYKREGVGNKWV